jgi:L-threonylcarbamoyladenylate synthase
VKTQTVAAVHDHRSAITQAVDLLRHGEVVALPTETVYGLAADALNPEAVLKIFAAKERPRFDPLIVHLPDRTWLEKVGNIPESDGAVLKKLTDAFWPGPLTLVLPKRDVIPDIVTAGLETVAVRMSAHAIFCEVIQAFGKPLAAPSANRFGRLSPTSAHDVLEELGGRVPLIVDAGQTEHGLESTIVSLKAGQLEILRRGPILDEQIAQAAGMTPIDESALIDTDRPRAPGRLPSHYAPGTPLLLVEDAASFVRPDGKRCGLVAWRSINAEQFAEVRYLSRRGDLREAAANLFRCLRELDQAELDLIVVEHVPERGLGLAIMDRLKRAATRSS